MRLGDVGAKLKAEMERAENTVVIGAQQLQGLAGSTQAKLKDTVAQAQTAISDVSALSRNGPRQVQASMNRVAQRIAPEAEPIEPGAAATQVPRVHLREVRRGSQGRPPDAETAEIDALRSDDV